MFFCLHQGCELDCPIALAGCLGVRDGLDVPAGVGTDVEDCSDGATFCRFGGV